MTMADKYNLICKQLVNNGSLIRTSQPNVIFRRFAYLSLSANYTNICVYSAYAHKRFILDRNLEAKGEDLGPATARIDRLLLPCSCCYDAFLPSLSISHQNGLRLNSVHFISTSYRGRGPCANFANRIYNVASGFSENPLTKRYYHSKSDEEIFGPSQHATKPLSRDRQRYPLNEHRGCQTAGKSDSSLANAYSAFLDDVPASDMNFEFRQGSNSLPKLDESVIQGNSNPDHPSKLKTLSEFGALDKFYDNHDDVLKDSSFTTGESEFEFLSFSSIFSSSSSPSSFDTSSSHAPPLSPAPQKTSSRKWKLVTATPSADIDVVFPDEEKSVSADVAGLASEHKSKMRMYNRKPTDAPEKSPETNWGSDSIFDAFPSMHSEYDETCGNLGENGRGWRDRNLLNTTWRNRTKKKKDHPKDHHPLASQKNKGKVSFALNLPLDCVISEQRKRVLAHALLRVRSVEDAKALFQANREALNLYELASLIHVAAYFAIQQEYVQLHKDYSRYAAIHISTFSLLPSSSSSSSSSPSSSSPSSSAPRRSSTQRPQSPTPLPPPPPGPSASAPFGSKIAPASRPLHLQSLSAAKPIPLWSSDLDLNIPFSSLDSSSSSSASASFDSSSSSKFRRRSYRLRTEGPLANPKEVSTTEIFHHAFFRDVVQCVTSQHLLSYAKPSSSSSPVSPPAPLPMPPPQPNTMSVALSGILQTLNRLGLTRRADPFWIQQVDVVLVHLYDALNCCHQSLIQIRDSGSRDGSRVFGGWNLNPEAADALMEGLRHVGPSRPKWLRDDKGREWWQVRLGGGEMVDEGTQTDEKGGRGGGEEEEREDKNLLTPCREEGKKGKNERRGLLSKKSKISKPQDGQEAKPIPLQLTHPELEKKGRDLVKALVMKAVFRTEKRYWNHSYPWWNQLSPRHSPQRRQLPEGVEGAGEKEPAVGESLERVKKRIPPLVSLLSPSSLPPSSLFAPHPPPPLSFTSREGLTRGSILSAVRTLELYLDDPGFPSLSSDLMLRILDGLAGRGILSRGIWEGYLRSLDAMLKDPSMGMGKKTGSNSCEGPESDGSEIRNKESNNMGSGETVAIYDRGSIRTHSDPESKPYVSPSVQLVDSIKTLNRLFRVRGHLAMSEAPAVKETKSGLGLTDSVNGRLDQKSARRALGELAEYEYLSEVIKAMYDMIQNDLKIASGSIDSFESDSPDEIQKKKIYFRSSELSSASSRLTPIKPLIRQWGDALLNEEPFRMPSNPPSDSPFSFSRLFYDELKKTLLEEYAHLMAIQARIWNEGEEGQTVRDLLLDLKKNYHSSETERSTRNPILSQKEYDQLESVIEFLSLKVDNDPLKHQSQMDQTNHVGDGNRDFKSKTVNRRSMNSDRVLDGKPSSELTVADNGLIALTDLDRWIPIFVRHVETTLARTKGAVPLDLLGDLGDLADVSVLNLNQGIHANPDLVILLWKGLNRKLELQGQDFESRSIFDSDDESALLSFIQRVIKISVTAGVNPTMVDPDIMEGVRKWVESNLQRGSRKDFHDLKNENESSSVSGELNIKILDQIKDWVNKK